MSAGLESGWFEGHRRLHFQRRRGPGPRILFLHGVLRCGLDFRPLLPLLDTDWDVFLIDQRGHGESEKKGGYRVMDYIADALQVVDSVGVEGLSLYGHSLGAMVAAAVAGARPVKVAILEDPPFETLGARIAGTSWQALFRGMHKLAQHGGGVVRILEGIGSIQIPQGDGRVLPLSALRDLSALHWSAQCLAQIDPDVLSPLVCGEWLSGWNWAGLFARALAPLLVLQGDEKSGGALAEEDLSVTGLPTRGFEKVFFEGSGHQLHWSDAKKIADLVNELRGGVGVNLPIFAMRSG